MRPSVLGFDALQGCHFREDKWKQATTVQFYKSLRRDRREKNLVQLIGDTFLADDFDAFLVPFESKECFVIDVEIQLGSKTDASHHAQWIVAEGDVRVERCPDGAFL